MKRYIWILACALRAAAQEEPALAGRPAAEWLKQLRSENRGLQVRAARTLAEAPTNLHARLAPLLQPLLASERENDRFVAAQVLGEYGPAARAAVPGLLAMLEGTQYERNRSAAAKALGQIFRDAPPSEEVERVAQALSRKINEDWDKYSDVRREAATALGMIGPAARSAIPKLVRALTDVDPVHKLGGEPRMVRAAAAWACGRMGPLAAEHASRLIAMMHAEGDYMPETVEALGRIGPVQPNIVPNIVDKIETSDGNQNATFRFRQKAFDALAACGPQAAPAVSFLARFVSQVPHFSYTIPVEDVTAAVRALRAIGPAAREALPAIEKLAALGGDGYAELRAEAARAIEAVTARVQ